MNTFQIAWGYVWSRKFITSLTIFSVALGVALISSVLTLRQETERRFVEEGQAFDAVIGAKGSPLQLVLSAVYYMDSPVGNIAWDEYERVLNHEWVTAAFPVSMGDTFRNARIVGTTPDLFDHTWTSPSSGEVTRPFTLAEGRIFEKPFEAVVGNFAASSIGLSIGDQFVGSHGDEDHADTPYTVVGIFEPSGTPNDHAIFCDLESVWLSHPHEDEEGESEEAHDDHDHAHHDHDDHGHDHERREITAVLVNLGSPAWRFKFRDEFKDSAAQAAVPVMEIQKMYSTFLSTVQTILMAVAYLVVVVASISIMVGLYLSIQMRRRDLAVMRALGAGAGDIFGAVTMEAGFVTILGVALGWLLGNVGTWFLSFYLTHEYGLTIRSFTLSFAEIRAFSAVLLVGYLAGVLPAVQAYRRDVARDLAEL
jgi:putative ABC transport system permease protein